MKSVGFVLIAVGLALFIFVIVSFFKQQNRIHSPIPQDEGIKVIFVTPSK